MARLDEPPLPEEQLSREYKVDSAIRGTLHAYDRLLHGGDIYSIRLAHLYTALEALKDAYGDTTP